MKLGRLMATRGVHARMCDDEKFAGFIASCISRHMAGDWGDLGDEDKQTNEQALILGNRLLSAYLDDDGTKVWVITEADRSLTTVLFPEEY